MNQNITSKPSNNMCKSYYKFKNNAMYCTYILCNINTYIIKSNNILDTQVQLKNILLKIIITGQVKVNFTLSLSLDTLPNTHKPIIEELVKKNRHLENYFGNIFNNCNINYRTIKNIEVLQIRILKVV